MTNHAPMTPEDARSILSLLDDDTVIGQADAQWALETIADEKLEYGVTAELAGGRRLIMSNTCHGNSMDGMGRWFPSKDLAKDFMRTVTAPEPRLVVRRASTYWEDTNTSAEKENNQ